MLKGTPGTSMHVPPELPWADSGDRSLLNGKPGTIDVHPFRMTSSAGSIHGKSGSRSFSQAGSRESIVKKRQFPPFNHGACCRENMFRSPQRLGLPTPFMGVGRPKCSWRFLDAILHGCDSACTCPQVRRVCCFPTGRTRRHLKFFHYRFTGAGLGEVTFLGAPVVEWSN